MASIRFVRNINLQVVFDDQESMVPFACGDIYTAKKIEVDSEGYSNIHMPDGSVINGVAEKVFENMGNKVPVTRVAEVATVPQNAEIEIEEEPVEVRYGQGVYVELGNASQSLND